VADPPEVLYLSYNGIAEPLVESQVLAYLRGLTAQGFRFTLLTFERAAPADAAQRSAALAAQGIRWHWLRSLSGLGAVSSWLDLRRGLRAAQRLHAQRGFRLVHARSFIPALIARQFKLRQGVPYLNDLRGFWVDEKVYRGRLRMDGTVYRIAKRLEARVLRDSDAIVSLSTRGARELQDFAAWRGGALPPLAVIPTCTDLMRFRPADAAPRAAPVFGYVGSLSEEYLPEQVLACFAAARRQFPGSRLHLITRSAQAPLRSALARYDIPLTSVRLTAVPPAEIPTEIRQFDVALSFIRPHFAKLASCPTKVGEYLACGVPVISNRDIGDMDLLLGDGSAGHVLADFSAASLQQCFAHLQELWRDPLLRQRCRALAEQHFCLADGCERYAQTYRQLLGDAG
jgi:glycosyltransferase involved in cell wall biosynthesis